MALHIRCSLPAPAGIALILLACILTGPPASAQRLAAPLFDAFSGSPETSAGERLTIRPAGFDELLAAHTIAIAEFPVAPGERSEVLLGRARPAIDARTRIVAGTRDGEFDVATPEITCFRGVISGENGSRVFLAACGEKIFCSITRGDGTGYVMAPATSGGDGLILIGERYLNPGAAAPDFSCATPDMAQGAPPRAAAPRSYISPATLLETEVAVEADYEYFRASGGEISSAVAYTAALFSMVSVLYEDELNVTLHIPWFKVWADSIADPYKVQGNAYALWDTVPPYWRAHYSDVPRHLAHVLTSINYGGGGIAYLGTRFEGGSGALCSDLYGYGMSSPTCAQTFPTFAFNYDVYIVAHELGHNFGARHTHTCWWNPPLDTCYTRDDSRFILDDACYALPVTPRASSGSIMSYCQNTNYGLSGDFGKYRVAMTFLPRVAEVMRSEAAAAECLAEPAEPTVILKSPRGDRSIPAGIATEIRWASAHVERITLQYSLDNGNEWLTIAPDVAAADGAYTWQTPAQAADRALVRIADATHPDVADTSILPFAIVAAAREMMDGSRPEMIVTLREHAIDVACRIPHATGAATLRLYDINGRECAAATMDAAAGGGMTSLSTAGLPNGSYIVVMESKEMRVSRRVVIAR